MMRKYKIHEGNDWYYVLSMGKEQSAYRPIELDDERTDLV